VVAQLVERPSQVRWTVLALLFLLASLAYVQRLNFQVASEAMIPDLGLSLQQMGWVFAAFSWGYALFQIPGGLLGVRFGFRATVLWIGVAWAILTALVGVVPGALPAGAIVVILFVLRLLMGIAQAPYFPLQGGVVERWFPPAGWAFPNGLVSCGLAFGAAATAPAVAWVMEAAGWRLSFFALAPLGLPLLALWWWLVRDDPATHPLVSPGELRRIREGRGAIAEAARPWRQRIAVLRDRRVLLLTASYFSLNYVFYMFFQWLFLYLVQERGFGVIQSGFLASLPWMMGAVSGAVGGGVCDLLCRRLGPRWGCRLSAMVPLPLVAVLLLVGARASGAVLAVAALTLCFACVQFTDAAYWAAATYAGGRDTAAATGVLNTGGNLPGILTGITTPILVAKLGWLAALGTGSLFAIVAALLWLWIDVGERNSS
jgi:MFS transporter, ACS family, glucarate transporter